MKTRPNDPCPCGSGKKFKKCHGASEPTSAPASRSGVADLLERARRMATAGRPAEAEICLRQALNLDPRNAAAWFSLGLLAETAADWHAAESSYTRLLEIDPAHARGHFAMGNLRARRYDFEAARESYLRALEADPKLPGVWQNLGNVEKYLGHLERAIECYRNDIELEPDPGMRARRHGNLLISLHYHENLGHDELFREHVDWADRHARAFYPKSPSWSNAKDPDRPLRLGYLSGSFNGLIVGHFLRNALAGHDRRGFHVTAYSSTVARDGYTDNLREHCDAWVEIASLDDAGAAERIRADGIDLLVDLDGHSPTGRPLVLARKPAPVQVEWLDWFDTTGMTVVDYVITDPYTTPVDSPQRFTETPWRLPHSRFCYTPPDYAPGVAESPCQKNGFVTFGSFNRQDKLNPRLIDLWAEILHAVPGSRLVLKNRALAVPAVRESLVSLFARSGIGRERLDPRGPVAHPAMLAEYADIDIALDTFPYNGGLTTCECLWMGVPIVAYEAERMIGRQTAAMLRLLGMDDWVARSPDDYARLAVEKSRDRGALQAVRSGLRGIMAASPLCDAERFARDLEGAYRAMWRAYCAKLTSGRGGD